MSQKFLFKWNNHMNVMNEFKQFLSFGIMVDVTLACDGQSFKAHKIVLSACSSFFRSLFLEHPCKHPIVILKDIKYTELKAIIDFMYCGEVYVAENQVSALIKAAQTLRVKGLGEVETQDNQAGYKSQNSSNSEFEDDVGDEIVNQSFIFSDAQKEALRQKQSVIEQSSNRDSASKSPIMENVKVKEDCVEPQDDNSCSTVSAVSNGIPKVNLPTPILKQYLDQGSVLEESFQDSAPKLKRLAECVETQDDNSCSTISAASNGIPRVNFPTSILKQYLDQGSVLEESFQDSAPKLKRLANTTESLPGQSSQSPALLNKELHQNYLDNSSSLVSETSTHVSSDATVTENQQPSTSSASGKRPLKKSVQQSLKKKVKAEKNPSQKSVKHKRNLRKPEVVIIDDSNSIKDQNKIKDSKNSKKEVKLYECKICPFKTISKQSLSAHVKTRHRETRKFKCSQCAFVTYDKYKFTRHNAVHKKERPYPCSLCTYKFSCCDALNKHVKKIHKLDRLIFKCQKCDFSAAKQGSIEKHRIDVHEKIPTIVINKLPEVITRSTVVINKSPEVINKSPEVVDKSPEVVDKSPQVIDKSPEVIDKSPEVVDKLPEVNKSPEVIETLSEER